MRQNKRSFLLRASRAAPAKRCSMLEAESRSLESPRKQWMYRSRKKGLRENGPVSAAASQRDQVQFVRVVEDGVLRWDYCYDCGGGPHEHERSYEPSWNCSACLLPRPRSIQQVDIYSYFDPFRSLSHSLPYSLFLSLLLCSKRSTGGTRSPASESNPWSRHKVRRRVRYLPDDYQPWIAYLPASLLRKAHFPQRMPRQMGKCEENVSDLSQIDSH